MRNFKIFGDAGVTLHPSLITVFIGANGTGKSTALQALLVLKQSLGKPQLESGGLYDFGSVKDLTFRKDESRLVELGVSASYENLTFDVPASPSLPESGTLSQHLTLSQGVVTASDGSIGREGAGQIQVSWRAKHGREAALAVDGTRFTLHGRPKIGKPIDINQSFNAEETDPEIATSRWQTLSRALASIEQVLENTLLVPALRGFDKHSYEILKDLAALDPTSARGAAEEAQLAANRSQFYFDIASGPFYGYNRPGAKPSQANIENWWRQGMMGGAKAHYDGIVAFSQTDFTEDLKKFTVPTLILHGDDDQIVPYADAGVLSAKLVKGAILKIYKGFPHGMPTTNADQINADLLAFFKGTIAASA